jgi:hypothetical protein
VRGIAALTLATMLGTGAPLCAQETQPLAWSNHRKLADGISTGLVAANVFGEAVHSFRSNDRRHAFGCMALRNGIAVGAAEATKALVHRMRPDGSDDNSFFSEHTAVAGVNAGWKYGLTFTIGTGYGRAAANKHFLSDIGVGALDAWLSTRVCRTN